MMRSTALLALLTVAIIFTAADAQVSSEADAPKEVVIGVLAPLSGPQAPMGGDIKNAALFMVEIINGRYGFDMSLAKGQGLPGLGGARVRLAFGDDAGDPEKGALEAARLIRDEGAVALVGSYSSDVTARASKIAEWEGIPFVSPICSLSGNTDRDLQWFFCSSPPEELYVANLFQFLDSMRAEDQEMNRLAVLYLNNSWGNSFRNLVVQGAERNGYDIIADVSYEPDDADLTDEVMRLKAAGDAVLLQASDASDAILGIQTYKRLNYTPRAIIADGGGFVDPGFVRAMGDDANFILSRDVWALETVAVNPMARDLEDAYRTRFGKAVSSNSFETFLAMNILVDAINSSGSTDPGAIREEILKTNYSEKDLLPPWKGVRFDPAAQQNVLGGSMIVQIHDGRYRVVWPPELARVEPIWPFPGWR